MSSLNESTMDFEYQEAFSKAKDSENMQKVASMIKQRNNWINNTYLNRVPLKTTYIETAFIMA